jgi:hypothetical protein
MLEEYEDGSTDGDWYTVRRGGIHHRISVHYGWSAWHGAYSIYVCGIPDSDTRIGVVGYWRRCMSMPVIR